jgi:ATP-dependent helicase HepA
MRQFKSANGKTAKVIVFGSDADDLKRCAQALYKELGPTTVLIAGDLNTHENDVAASFKADTNAQVLLCDRSNEEGLNLHFADFLVHLDLPFSLERIEQRIGRLDRFGRKVDFIKQRILLPGPLDETASYWDAWFDLLADGFHIFNTPLTDMQFLLSELTEELAEILFDEGAAGLRNAVPLVQERLQAEREKIDNQYALDRVLQDEEGAAHFCQQLEDVECDEDQLAQTAKDWFRDCLKFQIGGDIQNIFKIAWDGDYTLLPIRPWSAVFGAGLKSFNTFSRRVSIRENKSIQLQRVGSTLYRAAEKHLQWEDRGTAFATWRTEPSIGETTYIAFKLCYQIEGNLPSDLSSSEQLALRAKVDGYLPPWMQTIFIGSDLKPISDAATLQILSRPYDNKANGTSVNDINLGSRPALLQRVIDAEVFNKLCRVVRTESEDWLRQHQDFLEKVSSALTRGTFDLDRRNSRLLMRQLILRSEMTGDLSLQRDIELNSMLMRGLSTPKIRLDSIGVIVVSGTLPIEEVI